MHNNDFAEIVETAMQPLTDQYGIRPLATGRDLASFENDNVVFSVSKERGNNAIDLIIHRKGADEERYNIPELAAWVGVAPPDLVGKDLRAVVASPLRHHMALPLRYSSAREAITLAGQ